MNHSEQNSSLRLLSKANAEPPQRPPRRLQLPALAPTPKKSFLTSQSVSTLPRTCFQSELTDDIFSNLNNEYLNSLAVMQTRRTFRNTPQNRPIDTHSKLLSTPQRNKIPLGQSTRTKQQPGQLRLVALLEQSVLPCPETPLSSFEYYFRKTNSLLKPASRAKSLTPQPKREQDNTKQLNRRRMLGYKLEKLEMCSRELELIISETKKKVTKYGRNKITVDIGGL